MTPACSPSPASSQDPVDGSGTRRGAPAWSHDRCIVIDPPDDALCRKATDISVMGANLSKALRQALPLPNGRVVDMLRRTAKGGYCTQLPINLDRNLLKKAWALTSLTIAGVCWSCSPIR